MSKMVKDISGAPFTLQDCARLDGNPYGTFIFGIVDQNGKQLSGIYNTKNVVYVKDWR